MDLKDRSLESSILHQGNISCNLLWTSGKITISLPSHQYGSHIFQFHFNLNSDIKLNITFILLHLRGALLNCNFDKLEVKSLIKTKTRYRYCGYHSNFNLYPDMNIFTLHITLHLKKPFNLDARFSVTDRRLILNPLDSPSNEKRILFLFQLLCYKVASKYYLTTFHISLYKTYRAQIDIVSWKEKNYVIYDGPGYRFNFLNKNGGKSRFVASTFQCLLQFLLTYLFQWKLNYIFYYGLGYNDNKVFKTCNLSSEIPIYIPFSNCLSNFCVHHFVQPEGFYLNVTVLNLNVNSSETSH